MRTSATGLRQRPLLRWRPANPPRANGRGELAAGLATLTLIAEFLLVPLAVPVGGVLLGVSRITRWRPVWLTVPLLVGVGWLAGIGPDRTGALLAAGSLRFAGSLARAAAAPSRLLADPGAAIAAAVHWLPSELPPALVAGALLAALLGWLGAPRSGESWRPGLLAAVRRWRSAALLAAGHTVTETGCAVGFDPRTGKLVGLSWTDAGGGVLLTGTDPAGLASIAAAVTGAALRRRKTVLVIDLDNGRAGTVLAPLAGQLGVPVKGVAPVAAAVAAAASRAIRTRDAVLASGSGSGAPLIDAIVSVLAELAELSLHADCLVWISGCEEAAAGHVAALLELGAATGTTVLVSTTSAACAEALATHVGHAVACGPTRREFTVSDRAGGGARTRCLSVPTR